MSTQIPIGEERLLVRLKTMLFAYLFVVRYPLLYTARIINVQKMHNKILLLLTEMIYDRSTER